MIEREESISKLDEIHLINEIKNLKSVLWINPNRKPIPNQEQFSFQQMHEASERLNRLSSYIKVAFPETEKLKGIIESPLKEIPQMKKLIEGRRGFKIPGRLILKCDHSLPISGSIKG
ncbi:hypothetical protein [Ureibacillus endophyticus]|uniref:Uncharacterized protein n=1 Tax=Ureibacillus endophyticus TaxID=1978490 RepID=A0A494Z2G8_9BACL|nr:hypothetical protein [Lysinibacillus endophyticus]RKQ16497.1 hypothetical protein D8M03_09435 [Lysinibacillus endophyticus]